MKTIPTQSAPNDRVDYALRYAALGWSVLPLWWVENGRCACGNSKCSPNSWGKHPYALPGFAVKGVHSASNNLDLLRSWFTKEPRLNLGIALGDCSGIIALDVDPRNGGDITLEQRLREHGALPETALALTGGGGQHYLFRYTDQRLCSPGKGLDIKSSGGFIVVEPSTHRSGKSYAWEASSDPLNQSVIANPPAWLLASTNVTPAHTGKHNGYLHPGRIADLRGALSNLNADDYGTWIGVGQALHSTEAPEAFEIWDTWSQRSPKYVAGETQRRWGGFSHDRGLHVESIFAWAKESGWTGESAMPSAVRITPERIAPAQTGVEPPSHLLELPGALGELVRVMNATAPKCQPHFAVHGALALGATVLGRRYRTTMDNYPSLYFVAVGKSGCGKEYPRKVIETVLHVSGLGHLIGPGGYTSDSAVFSALQHQPSHIAIIDELGAMLGNAQAQGNFHKRQALDALVSAWGQLDGALRPLGYSTMALPAQTKKEWAARVVHRPALTLYGMTTPKTFYGSLTDQAIEGGFLNRLLVVETHIGRQAYSRAAELMVPMALTDWCRATREGRGNLAGFEAPADSIPDARVVSIEREARALLAAYDRDALRSADELDAEGLSEIEIRSHEKALRLALILAVSDDPSTPTIGAHHAELAIDYVRFYTAQTIRSIRLNMHGSMFGHWRQTVMNCITRAGAKGYTERELVNHCRTFAGMELRQRASVLESLRRDGMTEFALIAHPSGRGRPRMAWVALAEELAEAD